MAKYGNVSAVPLSLAVFLATDNYDYDDDPHTISATTLLKPLRQIILPSRIPNDDAVVDLAQMMQSRIGSAIHDAIERSWVHNYETAMAHLGFPKGVVSKIRINPKADELFDGCIPVYLEQRNHRTVGKHIVSGKFDFVGDGRVEDFKSTGVYTWMHNTNDERHTWQGSLYRWLNEKIVTKDEMAIQYIFTDWSRAKAMTDPKYPQGRTLQRILPLKSVNETHAFVVRKLALIDAHWDSPEEELPLCSDEDLWRKEPQFKYYKSGDTTKSRSTKNYDTLHDARVRMVEDGSVGAIKEVPGQVTACKYCPAFSICTQKDALIASGDLLMGI